MLKPFITADHEKHLDDVNKLFIQNKIFATPHLSRQNWHRSPHQFALQTQNPLLQIPVIQSRFVVHLLDLHDTKPGNNMMAEQSSQALILLHIHQIIVPNFVVSINPVKETAGDWTQKAVLRFPVQELREREPFSKSAKVCTFGAKTCFYQFPW